MKWEDECKELLNQLNREKKRCSLLKNEIVSLNQQNEQLKNHGCTIFTELYKITKRDFELVSMGVWSKSWIKDNLDKARNKWNILHR